MRSSPDVRDSRIAYLLANWHVANQWRACCWARNGALSPEYGANLHAKYLVPMVSILKRFGRWGLLIYLVFFYQNQPGYRK